MPLFADLFVEELRRKKQEVLRVASRHDNLAERYARLVEKVWVSRAPLCEEPGRVFAVDSSSDEIEVAGGGVLLVTRSLALGRGERELRELVLDPLYPKSLRDYEDYKRLLREHLEHVAALRALEDGADLVMIDGSLYGRMSHVLRELEVEGREGFMLEYVETYGKLLSEAVRNGCTIVGLSKDSRSTVLLEELLLLELRGILSQVDRYTAEKVLRLWAMLKRRPNQVLQELRRMVGEGLSAQVYELFEEARRLPPDAKILFSLDLEPGFTVPLMLSLERVSMGVVDVALTEDERFVEILSRVFEKTSDYAKPSFEELAERVLEVLKSYPPVLVSYVVLSRGDDPLRVDAVIRGSVATRRDSRFLEGVPEEFEKLLGWLAGFYAGRREYNVLLLEADRRVKATLETMELYHRLAVKELGEVIMHSRGERRVLYP